MKKPRIAFSPTDQANLKYFEMMKNSLRKFHSEEDLPLLLIGPEQIAKYNDPEFFYRHKPIVMSELIQEYETVIGIDADSIITGNLSHIWEDDFDVAVVQNSNPREDKAYPIRFLSIHPLDYVNCGLVVVKSEKFMKHWHKLAFSPHFRNFQYREQDLLNIMVHYGDYNVKFLDKSNKWHGLISKGYWSQIELRGDQLWLPKNEEWPQDEDKQIVVLHYAGGNTEKWRDMNIKFKPEIVKRIEELIN